MFRVICADPPWKFGDKLPGPGRGAEKHYRCLSVEELERFSLPPISDDAHLFLWRVASMQEEAFRVARAWGFVIKSELVWLKKTVTGKRHFGMGRQVRMEHETALICTRGRPQVQDRSIRSTFEAVAERVHSRKPEEFYQIVQRLCLGPYVELFARKQRLGWTCYGDELENRVAEAPAAAGVVE